MNRTRHEARARARAQWGKVLRLGGASWGAVADECGYANERAARICVLRYAADAEERALLITPPWRQTPA